MLSISLNFQVCFYSHGDRITKARQAHKKNNRPTYSQLNERTSEQTMKHIVALLHLDSLPRGVRDTRPGVLPLGVLVFCEYHTSLAHLPGLREVLGKPMPHSVLFHHQRNHQQMFATDLHGSRTVQE